jgi:hypothetical protein
MRVSTPPRSAARAVAGWLGLALACAGPAAAPGEAASLRTCNVEADVIAPEVMGSGTKVRATPAGKVIALLKSETADIDDDGWIEVHIAGQAGDWFLIDRAVQKLCCHPARTLFRGKGYVHRSALGAYGLLSAPRVHAAPDARSRQVHVTGGDIENGGGLIGCTNDWLQLRFERLTGWTRDACLNGLTTCV